MIKKLRYFAQRNRRMMIGCTMLAFLVLVAVAAPLLAPYDPDEISIDMVAAPSLSHLLGTDGLGRDVLSIIIYGSRTSLMVGITAAMIAAIVGTLIGVVAGFFGGKVDTVIGEFINSFMMMPTFFLILIVVALFGSGMGKVMVVIGLTGWTGNAKIMRAEAMSLRSRTFIRAAESIGESKLRIMFSHVIPNGLFPIIANTAIGVSTAIMTESSLSFLGLGDPNIVSWGQLIYNGKAYITSGWWMSAFGGLAIVYTVIAFFMIGEGLNLMINPKLRSVL